MKLKTFRLMLDLRWKGNCEFDGCLFCEVVREDIFIYILKIMMGDEIEIVIV